MYLGLIFHSSTRCRPNCLCMVPHTKEVKEGKERKEVKEVVVGHGGDRAMLL